MEKCLLSAEGWPGLHLVLKQTSPGRPEREAGGWSAYTSGEKFSAGWAEGQWFELGGP